MKLPAIQKKSRILKLPFALLRNLTLAEKLSLIFLASSLAVPVVRKFFTDRGLLQIAIALSSGAIFLIPVHCILINFKLSIKTAGYFFIAIGLLSFGYAMYRDVPQRYDYEKNMTVEFRLKSYPEVTRSGLRFTARAIIDDSEPRINGIGRVFNGGIFRRISRADKVSLNLPFSENFVDRGYRIEVRGLFFPITSKKYPRYESYLRSNGIMAIFNGHSGTLRVLEKPLPVSIFALSSWLKRYIENTNDKLLPFPHSVFATALLTGNRDRLPAEVAEIFRRSGTMHILAVSGLHVGFLSAFMLLALNLFPLKKTVSYSLLCIFIIFFMIFIGERPSVRRASIMALCGITCFLFDRDRDYLNVLALSFVVLWIVNPASLMNPGFLLSYCATFGIILLVPVLNRWLSRFLPSFLAASLATSLGVQIYLFPVMLLFFNSFPWINLLANIPIVPLTGVSLAVEVLTLTLYPVFLPLGIITAEVNAVVISTIVRLAYIFGKVPSFEFQSFKGWMVVAYLGIVTLGISVLFKKIDGRKSPGGFYKNDKL
jgi:ComEC/Rec2-related protein